MTWLPDDRDPEIAGFAHPDIGGAGGDPREASSPPASSATMSATERINDSRARLVAAADRSDIPPGTLPNLLGALARLDVAAAELERDPPDRDPAAIARAAARTDQLVELLEMYCVRLLELNDQVSVIFGEMADALAGYTRDCTASRPLWMAIRRAQSLWSDAHQAAVTDPELPDEPHVDPQAEPDCQGPDDRHVDPQGEPLQPLDPVGATESPP